MSNYIKLGSLLKNNEDRNHLIESLNVEYAPKPIEDLLQWAIQNFSPSIKLACSFSPEDIILLHMLSDLSKDLEVFYIDTGYLFEETYELIDTVIKRYKVNFERIAPQHSEEGQDKNIGSPLYKTDPNLCCTYRKVDPLKKVITGLDAWVTGLRREQSPTRAYAQLIEWDAKNNLIKINPLVFWKTTEVWEFVKKHDIPYNALYDKSYTSIGCQPCTSPVQPGEDIRAGRWRGQGKQECGFH